MYERVYSQDFDAVNRIYPAGSESDPTAIYEHIQSGKPLIFARGETGKYYYNPHEFIFTNDPGSLVYAVPRNGVTSVRDYIYPILRALHQKGYRRKAFGRTVRYSLDDADYESFHIDKLPDIEHV